MIPERFEIVYFGNDWFAENRTSSHHIAKRLAARFPLLYVEMPGLRAPQATGRDVRKMLTKIRQSLQPPRQTGEQMWHITVPQLPFRNLPLAASLNERIGMAMIRRAIRAVGLRSPISWFVVPHPYFAAKRMGEKLAVYYCIDHYAGLPSVDAAAVQAMDDELTRRADMVFACSPQLVATKSKTRPDVIFSPHGVDAELFGAARLESTPLPSLNAEIRHPVIGCWGLIDSRINFNILTRIAESHPEWTLVLLGHVQSERHVADLRTLPNVRLPGVVPYHILPSWAKMFDVCIMPYTQDPLIMQSNPLKLREYLAAGKPIVSVPVPEVERFGNVISIASSPEAFVAAIEAALRDDTPDQCAARQHAVQSLTWDARVEEILAALRTRVPAAR